MKRCNKITVIWTCAIVVVALFWGVALYNNCLLYTSDAADE